LKNVSADVNLRNIQQPILFLDHSYTPVVNVDIIEVSEMDFNEIKEYLKELMANDDDFWTVFNAEDYYSRMDGAFKDEGDDWECGFCSFQIESSDCVESKDAIEMIEEHLQEKHTWDILMKEIKKNVAANKDAKQLSLMEAVK
jgi:hypothetical protein